MGVFRVNCKGKLETETRLYVALTGSRTLKDGDKAMEHFVPEVVDTNKSSRVKKYQAVFETAWPGLWGAIKDDLPYEGSKEDNKETNWPPPHKKRKTSTQSAIENTVAAEKSEINRHVATHNPYETRGEAEDEPISHPEIPMPDTTMRKLSKQFFTHELSFTAEPELRLVKEMRQWRLNTGQFPGILGFPLTFYSFLSNIL